ncbi:hypothetical protein [Bradyrhizobium sp. CCBAU 11361]|uniref:hypothetical protein n=1 Tax=Bradyrhizobium sp. CCBAU 11361 TaxID=1630812 RepID=UPI002304B6D2|nr:hypothetical protein [Bradyrhizobium sp. CCBAU 11361]MDA9489562.1 hypothetical protein [Bradyrhizobium sp. CCBAU 11361]
MNLSSLIARTLAIVDKSLRSDFPNDYQKRCMYAAFGASALLQDAGHPAAIVGGDFVAFVVATSGERAGLQGFGFGKDEPSHFWVTLDNTIIDLGPHYLPRDSRYPAQPLPLVAWSPASRLPKYLRYRAEIEYDPAVRLNSTPEIEKRMDTFVARCRKRFAEQRGQPKLPRWVLMGEASLAEAAAGGDAWAQNALRFAAGIGDEELPF